MQVFTSHQRIDYYLTFALFLAFFMFGSTLPLQAQQLANSNFEDWSAPKFDGAIQPASWSFSNVTQVGIDFNFAHREPGRTGYCAKMINQSVGAMGITETAPGYMVLGKTWSYLEGISVKSATAGSVGGISFAYRPDTLSVWIKRTGSHTDEENFNILFYSWTGTAKGSAYPNKGGGCTSTSRTDEESDIRQALDKNACTTTQYASQVAEGWLCGRAQYNDWTQVKIPIYYFNSDVPEKCNVLFSCSRYPDYFGSTGLKEGNALWVDDVELIYSSKIQKLYIGNKLWAGFDPNSSAEQTYSLGDVTVIPEIYGMRGEGTMSSSKVQNVPFAGRRLSDSEMTVQYGEIDGAPTVITVTAGDGSSTTTYRIKFISRPSSNARVADIKVNGQTIAGFNPYITTYQVGLPYGTTATPVVSFTPAEDGQVITLVQPTSTNGTATLAVVAPDGTTRQTYTLSFYVQQLDDNTLTGININGTPLDNFRPSQTIYKVELPLSTTTMPTVQAVSAYPEGAQTIVYTAPATIDGGQYQIAVSTPGNPTPKIYKLNFKITASTNAHLSSLAMEGGYIDFDPEQTTYYVNLPMGTTALPQITYTPADAYQTITVEDGGIDGQTRIVVTAGAGNQMVYKIVCSTDKSDISYLNSISVGGVALPNFDPQNTTYDYVLPMGTTEVPSIVVEPGDEYQTISIQPNGINGTARITVTAGDGSVALYQIRFSVLLASNNTLNSISVNGEPLPDFNPEQEEYNVVLPQSTTQLPVVTFEQHDEFQTVTARPAASLNGDYRLTVRPQSGSPKTYILHFSVLTSSNTALQQIYLNGEPLENFDAATLAYSITLPMGESTLPTVTYEVSEPSQKVFMLQDGSNISLRVTAQSGASQVYTLAFELQQSQNALLNMIYLDGQPLEGFVPTQLAGYTVLIEDHCPVITVDKDPSQQVSIMTPTGVGEAVIQVTPQSGAANRYSIRFGKAQDSRLLLSAIYLDGEPLAGFEPTNNDYSLPYTQTLPVVTYEAQPGIQVQMLTNPEQITLLLQNAQGEQNGYVLHFVSQLSNDASLKSLSLNGQPLAGFDPQTLSYSLPLAFGESLPTVAYETALPLQTVTLGQTDDHTLALTVTAPDAQTIKTYTLSFTKELHQDALLNSISLDGTALPNFDPHIFTYTRFVDKGEPLPQLTYTATYGLTTFSAQTSALEQQIIVRAQDGSQNTYILTYREQPSAEVHLHGILLDGKPLDNFDADTLHYTVTLPWRTRTVPCITPVAGSTWQTITVTYQPINQTTTIHVLADDQIHSADYTIDFPVVHSSNTLLESVVAGDVDFDFVPTQTDYTFELAYDRTDVPILIYEKQETEQTVEYIAAKMGQTSKLIVTAENGDQRTYNFTFKRALVPHENVLSQVMINGVAVPNNAWTYTASKDDQPATYEYHYTLPYHTTNFEVSTVPAFEEQTVVMEQMAAVVNQNEANDFAPTSLLVYSGRENEQPVRYIIYAKRDVQSPAVLSSLMINGTPLADFDPNRLEYRADVSASQQPVISYTKPDGVTETHLEQDYKHWACTVQAGAYSHTYRIVFYYNEEVIPNANLRNWTKAKYNNADKPIGWQVPSDYYNGTRGSYHVGDEVKKYSSDLPFPVLKTTYNAAFGGTGNGMPAVITLGSLNVHLAVGGGSYIRFGGHIDFHNTPDAVDFAFHYPHKAQDGALFAFRFFDSHENETKFDYLASSTTSEVTTIVQPLATDGTEVSFMNIAVDAAGADSGDNDHKGAELWLDHFRFIFNSELKNVVVNGDTARVVDNRTFSFTLPSSENLTTPELGFAGVVSDQARAITWTQSGNQWTANVRNFAEDGTYTDYRVLVTRPLSEFNTLNSLEINGLRLDGFNKDQTEYSLTVPAEMVTPSVSFARTSYLSSVAVATTYSEITVTVTAESGAQKVYTVHLNRILSSDTTLKSLTAEGVQYQANTHEYVLNATTMPEIRFEKNHDAQTVELHNGVLTVTAQDGTKGQYTIRLQPTVVPTTGQLTHLALNDMDLQGFEPNTYEYEVERPTFITFSKEALADGLVQTMAHNGIRFHVTGSQVHDYVLTYPQRRSSQTALEQVLIDGQAKSDFLAVQSDYTIATNEPHDVQLVKKDSDQQIIWQIQNDVLTVHMTAADGTVRNENYTFGLQKELSQDATLSMIYLDNTPLATFEPNRLQYTIRLASGNPKTCQPVLPNLTYRLSNDCAKVSVETAPLGQTTYLTVTSEDGLTTLQYELLFEAEKSSNAYLNNLLVNGQTVAHFEPSKGQYSAQVEGDPDVQYSALDRFQTYTQRVENNTHYITVTAEDGVSTMEYAVDVYAAPISNNAFLQDMQLGGMPFSQLDTLCEDFEDRQLRYTVSIRSKDALPDLFVALQEEGQTWSLSTQDETYTVHVVAADGVSTNDYVIRFNRVLSSNNRLGMIYLNSEALPSFDANTTHYTVDLPVGTTTLPQVDVLKGETEQTYTMSQTDDACQIVVKAEDRSLQTYTLKYNQLLSQADTLAMVYADGLEVAQFAPHQFYYVVPLAVGDTVAPTLTFDPADQYQTVTQASFESAISTTYQFTVLSQSGKKNIYTLVFEYQKSAVDTLKSIYVGTSELAEFDAQTLNYVYVLPEGAALPYVDYVAGDAYQTVTQTADETHIAFTVTAQNGNQKVYTLTFVHQESDNAALTMLYYGGEAVPNFDEEVHTYRLTLPYGTSTVPALTFDKAEEAQNVTLQINDWTAVVTVLAADGQTKSTYTLTFEVLKSDNAYLQMITLDGAPMPAFVPTTTEYAIVLPFGTDSLPVVDFVKQEEAQSVTMRSNNGRVEIEVVAGNGEDMNEYLVELSIERSPINTLSDLTINGTTVTGFDALVNEYVLSYPAFSTEKDFVGLDNIGYTLTDTTATVALSMQDDGTLTLIVTAANGAVNAYVVRQIILLNDNALLRDLQLNGVTLASFDPEQLAYEYLLLEGGIMPFVTATAQDSLAEVSVTMGEIGGLTHIYCTAQDGTENEYTILFKIADWDTGANATAQDVLFLHVPGSDQYVALTTRQNVQIALYDAYGHLLTMQDVPVCDPNLAAVVKDANSQDLLLNAAYTAGTLLEVSRYEPTYYAFFQNAKKRVASGKVMLVP